MGGRRVKVDKAEEAEKPKPQEPKGEAKPVKGKKISKPSQKFPKGGKVRGKKYQAAKAKVEVKEYPLEEAVKKVKELSYAKFDSSVDAHITLGLEKDKAGQQIRTFVSLPHGTGKSIKILVFAEGTAAKAALDAGADEIGGEELVEKIAASGGVGFGAVVATPAFMPKIAKIARILGPKGLMPTPKTGTVTDDPAKVVGELKKGRLEIKTEAQPVVHVSIGRVSFPEEQLVANFKAVLAELNRIRPPKVRGDFIRSVFLAPTMGPSVKIALDSIV